MEKKREGRFSGVYFGNVCGKRILKRLSISVDYVVVECFSVKSFD